MRSIFILMTVIFIGLSSSSLSVAGFERNYIKENIKHYPHKGVEYYNLTEIFKDVSLNTYIIDRFSAEIRSLSPDYIAAPEARALPIFGALIYQLQLPGIFIRKAGKIPSSVPKVTVSYQNAYSMEGIEATFDKAFNGKRAVIVDDGIASGGTTLATIELLESSGMEIVGIFAIVDHHYVDRKESYQNWNDSTFTLFDL